IEAHSREIEFRARLECELRGSRPVPDAARSYPPPPTGCFAKQSIPAKAAPPSRAGRSAPLYCVGSGGALPVMGYSVGSGGALPGEGSRPPRRRTGGLHSRRCPATPTRILEGLPAATRRTAAGPTATVPTAS